MVRKTVPLHPAGWWPGCQAGTIASSSAPRAGHALCRSGTTTGCRHLWEASIMGSVNLEQAVQGLMNVEQRILACAAQRNVRGFKIEWNEDLDFGHLMDPVPVALLTDGGRVDGQFALADLAQVARSDAPAVRDEIERLIQRLGEIPHSGPPVHEPPGSP
jgi:hypothetical protein